MAFQVRGCIGLVGPAGMPAEIVRKLSDMMVEGGKTERIQKILDTFGIDEAARESMATSRRWCAGGPDLDRPDQEPEHRAAIG